MSNVEIRSKKTKKTVLVVTVVAVVIVLAATIGIVLFNNTEEKKISRKHALADRYISELKYEEAVAVYNEILQIDPQNVDAYSGLFGIYMGNDDFDNAEKVVQALQGVLRENHGMESSARRIVDEMVKRLEGKRELVITSSPTPTVTDTPIPTYTLTPATTNTPLPTYTPIPTVTNSPTPTSTLTPTPTNTPSPIPTFSVSYYVNLEYYPNNVHKKALWVRGGAYYQINFYDENGNTTDVRYLHGTSYDFDLEGLTKQYDNFRRVVTASNDYYEFTIGENGLAKTMIEDVGLGKSTYEFEYDSKGRQVRCHTIRYDGEECTTTYEYDKGDCLVVVTDYFHTIEGQPSDQGYTVIREMDKNGFLTKVTELNQGIGEEDGVKIIEDVVTEYENGKAKISTLYRNGVRYYQIIYNPDGSWTWIFYDADGNEYYY